MSSSDGVVHFAAVFRAETPFLLVLLGIVEKQALKAQLNESKVLFKYRNVVSQ